MTEPGSSTPPCWARSRSATRESEALVRGRARHGPARPVPAHESCVESGQAVELPAVSDRRLRGIGRHPGRDPVGEGRHANSVPGGGQHRRIEILPLPSAARGLQRPPVNGDPQRPTPGRLHFGEVTVADCALGDHTKTGRAEGLATRGDSDPPTFDYARSLVPAVDEGDVATAGIDTTATVDLPVHPSVARIEVVASRSPPASRPCRPRRHETIAPPASPRSVVPPAAGDPVVVGPAEQPVAAPRQDSLSWDPTNQVRPGCRPARYFPRVAHRSSTHRRLQT